jgi:hypothetical protein
VSRLAVWLLGAFVLYVAQTLGWGVGVSMLLVLLMFLIAYAWSRLRPKTTATDQDPS